jgi:hypothetical protein
MVATYDQVATSHEQIADFAGPKRARHTIAKVDCSLDITTLDVYEHGFACWQVSVDFCNNRDTHLVVPRSRARSYPHIVRRSALAASLSGIAYATWFDQQQLYLVLGVGLVLDSFGNDEHLARC